MKYLLTVSIVAFSLFFSSIFSASAEEGYLEQLLQLSTGLESSQMEKIPELETQKFSNPSVQKTFDEFIKLDRILRAEFIRQFENGDISYYQMQDLITSYGNFLYYTNKTFGYIVYTDKGLRGDEIDRAIESGYSNMRMSYAKVKGIIANN